ncbi:Eco57I restriction-modification methylase domain-containing protein [Bdellovibrio sp.]|uniref:Eco57I restriction-modification methylase domain-containing protein n=1 Tax=Bdellovibrio sp. TaxID=28201 RepID=UPI0039E6264D
MSALVIKPTTHVVDVLGNVIGRDQPILRMEKALEMVALLGEEVFADENVVFFDPFCKAGELLLACAFHSCWAKSKSKVLDVDMVMKEIYQSNRYFGLAPDERHHRLSIRTFLGNENSHKEEFNHIIRDGHYLSEEDGTLDEQKFEREFNSMIEYINSKEKDKKIIAVGNPPYSEEDGGHGRSSNQIYPYFTEHLMDDPRISDFVLVIPAKWFSAGKNTKHFRKRVIESFQFKTIRYFQKSEEVFPTVQVKGGICYLNWSEEHNGSPLFIDGNQIKEFDLSKHNIISDDPESDAIVSKIFKKCNQSIADIAWSRKPFGLPTNYFKANDSLEKNDDDAIPCFSQGRKLYYANRNHITKNRDKTEWYKVVVPKAYGKGMRRCTIPAEHIFIIQKGYITTETYNVVGCFKTKTEAESFQTYLQTDFSRYLLGLRKLTQDIPKDRWNWVPLVDLDTEWTDKKLAKHFGLTEKEQEHIKKKVQEWS